MMIALPNPDGSFTCTLFWRHDGEGSSFAAIRDGNAALAHFRAVYPDAVPLMPTLAER
jgi:kynurenine 3-monooxygenase